MTEEDYENHIYLENQSKFVYTFLSLKFNIFTVTVKIIYPPLLHHFILFAIQQI